MKGMCYFLTVALLYPGVLCYAQSDSKPENWAGQLVVGKKPASEITFGRTIDGQVVNFQFEGIYPQRVREDKDGWLRLFDGHKEGWAKKDEFLLSRDAVSYFTDRINANGQDDFAWWMRGNAWKDRGEFDNALKDYTECIRLDPKDFTGFNSRGTVWVIKKEYDKAIEDYDEAIRLDPKFVLGFHNRARVWYHKKEYGKAIADFDEAIRLDPKFALAFVNRARAWRAKKEYDKAINDCGEAIRIDSKNTEAYNNRGWYRYLMKDYDLALLDFEVCLKLDPKYVWAIDNRGKVFAAQKKYPQAVEAFEAAIVMKNKSYSPYEYAEFLASCPEAKYRDGKKAVELAKRSLEMQGKEAVWEVHAALAAAYAEVGDFELAVISQRKALDDKTCTDDDRKAQEIRLELYRAKKPYRMVK